MMTGFRNKAVLACLPLMMGLVASCSQEKMLGDVVSVENNGNQSVGTTIMAYTEAKEGTRTSLSGDDTSGYQVLWSEGDEISAVDADERTFQLTLSEGAGETSGVFTCSEIMPDGNYKLFYGTEGSSLDREQKYMGKDVISNSPMYANVTVTDGKVPAAQFKNLCGLLRLTLKGSDIVTKITITADGDPLSGPIVVNNDGSIVFNRSYHPDVSLTLGEGVELSSEGTDFYIALPPNNYSNISITVTEIDGYECTKTLKSGSTLNIARAMISPASFTVTFDKPLSWNSPVGTVGMLDGREAMVLNFGDGIGKLAMATMNIGASTYTEAGTFYTWYEAVQKQNNGEFGGGWYLPSEPEVLAKIGYIVRKEGNVAIVDVTESSTLKIPLAGYYYNAGNTWDLVDKVAFLWSSDPAFPYEWGPSMDLATLSFYNGTMCSLNVKPQDKLNIRPFHKLPITRNTPVGMVGYLDGKDAMVVELDVNGQKKKVAVAIRNEGATNTKIYINTSNTKYLDCFGSFLTYAQAENKCTDGWYIPTIEEWQSLMANASVAEDKLAYENTFSSNDKHRAIVVNVNGNSLILPAGGPDADSTQRGWSCYYWSSTPDGSQMKYLFSRGNSISILSSEKYTTKNTRLFHAIP